MKAISYLIAGAMLFGLLACNSRQKADEKSERIRGKYNQAIQDSVDGYFAKIKAAGEEESVVNDQVNTWMRDFTTVAKPREAGSYTIMSSWQNRYPLTATGLIARLNDNGQFELIAALSGGNFNVIEVVGPSVSCSSQVVQHDQALNYRAAGLNTVSFTGEKADSIGQMIADNELNPLTLNFLQGGKVSSWKIPGDYAKMISYTYLLYSNKRKLATLAAQQKLYEEKIKILRQHSNRISEEKPENN